MFRSCNLTHTIHVGNTELHKERKISKSVNFSPEDKKLVGMIPGTMKRRHVYFVLLGSLLS